MPPHEVLAIAAAVLLLLLAGAVMGVLAGLAILTLLVRPWDGCIHRDYRWVTSTPFCVFWLGSWMMRAAESIVALKPGSMRAAELATAYIQSQVLFPLVNLGIPDALTAGPLSAAELAAGIGSHVKADWLDRLLAAAASFGMLNCSSSNSSSSSSSSSHQAEAGRGRPGAPDHQPAAGAAAGAAQRNLPQALPELPDSTTSSQDTGSSLDDCKDQDIQLQQVQQHSSQLKLALAGPVVIHNSSSSSSSPVYSLNAVSAALTSGSPASMAAFVKLFEDHYQAMTCLSEGLRSGVVPFELWSGGKTFWQHITDSQRHAQTFDAAMHQVNHIGGEAVVSAWPWHRYTCVVDVAGGVGGFMAGLLHHHHQLRGVVLDQPEQIDRANKLWSSTHISLAPRVQLLAGNMFDAATIPTPAEVAPQGHVAYTLRNILHDWSDADSREILMAIRSRITSQDVAAGRARLLLVETSTATEVLPTMMPFRRSSDITMLMAFGDGKERNKQQFEDLLAAANFKLLRIKPANGIFVVIEAAPV